MRLNETHRKALTSATLRLEAAPAARLKALADRLEALDRVRQALGYTETLRRGYAVVRSGEALVTTAEAARAAQALEIEFADGRVAVGQGGAPDGPMIAHSAAPQKPTPQKSAPKPKAPAKAVKKPPEQGSLF